MQTKVNPEPLPNTLEFQLKVDSQTGLLVQTVSEALSKSLKETYKLGFRFGTPLDADLFGSNYAADFLRFIKSNLESGKVLEIGAGTGYLANLLHQEGFEVLAIEPGHGFENYWKNFTFPIFRDFFPSESVTGKFKAIIAYAVLEHIEDLYGFYESVVSFLEPDGQLIVSVPDCTVEMGEVDPSMLIHEHISYFSQTSLLSSLNSNFLHVKVEKSKYARTLFASAKHPAKSYNPSKYSKIAINESQHFIENIPSRVKNLKSVIGEKLAIGQLGVYCPSRALNYLHESRNLRFFDDDPNLIGKYLPPFSTVIESGSNIFDQEICTVFIASRTFESTIREKLTQGGYIGEIVSISDVVNKERDWIATEP